MAGWSADIELVHPVLADGGCIGAATADIDAGSLRWAVVTEYERRPLVSRQHHDEVPVVGNRDTVEAAFAWDVGPSTSLRLSVPLASQWGSSSWAAADGIGFGDVRAGVRGRLVHASAVGVVAGLDVALPTGARDAWLGEDAVRLSGEAAASGGERLRWAADLGFLLRQPIVTDGDLVIGPDVHGAFGVSRVAGAWAPHADLLWRRGLGNTPGQGGSEALVGLRWDIGAPVLDLAVGHGVGRGYGTTDGRVMLGIEVVHDRPTRSLPAPSPVAEPDDVEDAPDAEPVVAVTVPAPPPALATVVDQHIDVAEAIQFERGTARILPASEPVLEAIARVLNERPDIGQLVIVGHASSEGSYGYNFDLSEKRAASVFRALVARGIDPDRLSWRAMGEIEPAARGDDAASLEANRRVEFRIVRWLGPDEAPPPPAVDKQPWDGAPWEPASASAAPAPAPAPQEAP